MSFPFTTDSRVTIRRSCPSTQKRIGELAGLVRSTGQLTYCASWNRSAARTSSSAAAETPENAPDANINKTRQAFEFRDFTRVARFIENSNACRFRDFLEFTPPA